PDGSWAAGRPGPPEPETRATRWAGRRPSPSSCGAARTTSRLRQPASRARPAASSHSLRKRMLGTGIPALAYLGGIQLDGLAHVLREPRIALHQLRLARAAP